jgi:hypothetical protein
MVYSVVYNLLVNPVAGKERLYIAVVLDSRGVKL